MNFDAKIWKIDILIIEKKTIFLSFHDKTICHGGAEKLTVREK